MKTGFRRIVMTILLPALFFSTCAAGCSRKVYETQSPVPAETETVSAGDDTAGAGFIVPGNEADPGLLEIYGEVLDRYYYMLTGRTVTAYERFNTVYPAAVTAPFPDSEDGYDGESALDGTGFGFSDHDGDGMYELIVGSLSADPSLDKVVYGVYTVRHQVPYAVIVSSGNTYYYICGEDRFCCERPGWRWSMYERAEDGVSVKLVEGIALYNEGGSIQWKKISADGSEGPVAAEEADRILTVYENSRQELPLSPFSEYKPVNPEEMYTEEAGTVFGKGFSSWQEGYLAYYEDHSLSELDTVSCTLIYVDGDDIPELTVSSGVEAGGCETLSFHDGMITVLHTSRLNLSYIEKRGLLCNSDGVRDHYYDVVYSLEKGRWRCLFNGAYFDIDPETGVRLDKETGRYHTLHYRVGDTDTDEETYLSRLNEVYDIKQAVRPGDWVSADSLPQYMNSETRKIGENNG